MKALRILEDEHRTFGALLGALRHLVRETRDRGASPRFDALGALLYFFDTFLERIHHPRETEHLFRLLRARCPEAVALLDRLDHEHEIGHRAIQALEQALTRYRHGGDAEFGAFAAAAEAYVEGQQRHLRREDDEVLPLARAHLTPDDWRAVDEVFAGNNVPQFGREATAEYEVLFRRLVAMLPPPIGVGPP